VHWFESIKEAEGIIKAWQADYNESRPHMALKGMTPAGFAEKTRLGDRITGQQAEKTNISPGTKNAYHSRHAGLLNAPAATGRNAGLWGKRGR
jgi:hypothetical protein